MDKENIVVCFGIMQQQSLVNIYTREQSLVLFLPFVVVCSQIVIDKSQTEDKARSKRVDFVAFCGKIWYNKSIKKFEKSRVGECFAE